MGDAAAIYDRRYTGDYRQSLNGYEIARWCALEHFLRRVAHATDAEHVLDYGCGSGLHVPLWDRCFPNAELACADISTTALEKLRLKHPDLATRTHLIEDDRVDVPTDSRDVIVSVEVMEHVEDLGAYLREVHRLLTPGGVFVWTTPCANALSIEHVYAETTAQTERSSTGERRWAWEDPTHLRRLTSREAASAARAAGFERVAFRFRAHLFSFVCTRLLQDRWAGVSERLMLLDYALLRALPNGASMIGAAWKPNR